jgi:hypothetical protein
VNGTAYTGNNLQNLQGGPFVTSGGTLSTNAYIGGNAASSGAISFIGNISEILVYNRALNNYERQQVEGYLALKWGITPLLPEATHPYYNPLERGFTPYNVFGSNNLRTWLDASTLPGSDGSAVTSWTDSSAFANTGGNALGTAPTLATSSLNGRNTVAFNGTNQFMRLGNPGALTASAVAFTIFFVAQTTTTSTNQQTVFTQGPIVYPPRNALNPTATPAQAYFDTAPNSNKVGFDMLGFPSGTSIPTSNSSYTNTAVMAMATYNPNATMVAYENGNLFYSSVTPTYNLDRTTGQIGASKLVFAMTLTDTNTAGNATITSTVPLFAGQAILFSTAVGGIAANTLYYILNSTGSGPNTYTITLTSTVGGSTPVSITSNTSGGTVPTQAYITLTATTNVGNYFATIISSVAPVVGQAIIFAATSGLIISNTHYYIRSVTAGITGTYTITLSTTLTGSILAVGITGPTAVQAQIIANYLSGNIAEIIYFAGTTINTVQRQRLEGYLAWKWGLQAQLPTSHPFYLANYFYNNTKPTSRIFAPPDIEGCQLWIDPTDLQTAGYAVSAWNDKTTGTAYHATQATTSLRPYYIPAQKGIYFATSEYLSLPNSALSLFQNVGYASMFMVVRVPQPSTTVGGALFGANTTAGTDRFRPSIVASSSLYATYGAILQRANSDAVVTTTSAVAYPYGGMTILNIEVTYSTNSARFSRNGTQDYLGTAGLAAAGVTDNTASTLITVGAPVGGRQDNFYMHELLLYTSATNSPLSTADRDLTHGYLAWKWGLQTSLPNSSVYSPFNTIPATAGPSAAATGYKLWLDGADDTTITYTANSVAMLTDKSGSENPVVNNQSTLTMTTYTKPEGTTLPMLQGSSTGAANTLTTRTVPRDTSNHTYAFVVKYPNSGNASFVPTQFPGCALWLDAADTNSVSVTAGNVTSVNDKSGNGYTMTKTGAGNIPYASSSLNGLNMMTFSGSNTYLATSSTNFDFGTNDFAIFTVVITSSTSNGLYPIISKNFGNATNAWTFWRNNGNQFSLNNYNSGSLYSPASSSSSVASSTPYFTSVTSLRTTTTNVYANGVGGTPGGASASANTVGSFPILIGATPTLNFGGQIGEIIVYNGTISTAQRQQVEGYLAWKWGLQANLPATHPYTAISPFPPKTVLSYTPPTPLVLSGLGLWLDASNAASVIRSGSNVTRWNDLSGNGRNMLYEMGTLTYNTTGFNGNPTITFGPGRSGFTYSGNSIDLSSTNSLSIYIVLRPSSTSSGNIRVLSFFAGGVDYTPPGFVISIVNTTPPLLQVGVGRGAPYLTFNPVNVSNTNIFTSIIFNGNLSTNPAVPLNNTGIGINGNAFSNLTGYSIGTNFSTYTFRIGEWSGASTDIFIGNISEILMFTRALNATENQQIEGYLATKWGLQTSLPNTHLYASPYGTETFGHSGTDTNPRLENFNNIPGGISTYSPYSSVANADAFYGGNTFVCMCVRQNGVWTFTTNGVNYGTISPYALRKLASGAYSLGVNNFSSAQLGDVIVYNNAISPGEQQQLEGYLAWKWGLQRSGNSNAIFPSTHPFYSYPPSTTVPLVNATQLYKKTFDITDLAPALWLDANDPNTYVLDANNRVQWITNKGLGGLKATFTISSVSGTTFNVSSTTSLSPGQAFEFAVTTITISGITPIVSTPAAPVFFYVLTVSGTTITISSTFGGTALTGASGTATCYVSQRFTKPVGTSSGVGLNGPLLTQSAIGTGNGLNYLDFSSGGTFKITGGTTDSAGTSVVLTLNALHNIPATRQVRVVVSGGTYSTDSSSATGITGTYIVSSQTGSTITIPYTSSKSSATINNLVGYVEYGSIIISDISMASGSPTAVFNTSFPHGLTTSDSIFLSLAGSTIANFPVALNLANGTYTPSAVTSTSFTITTLLNLGGSAITSGGTITNTSLTSTTSPSYAYFPYNGYALESMSAGGVISSSIVNVFIVTHTNQGAGSLAASSITRCGRNVERQPPIFATAVTSNAESGADTNSGGATVFGNGRDFNVRLANYNAVGNQLTPSTTPSIRLGIKRNSLSITSAALTDTSRSVTNTTNGFRIMNAFVSANGGTTEQSPYGMAVTTCGWKPTSFNSSISITGTATPLMNTVYANNTAVLQAYQVSSTGSGSLGTATFVPYGIEPGYVPFYVGLGLNVFGFIGAAAGYVNASAVVSGIIPPTATTVTFNTTAQQSSGTITGQTGTLGFNVSPAQTPSHIRIGADTNATTSYSSLAGYLTDRFFDGGIAEILVFNGAISPEQRMLVEGYLAQKYNFQEYLGSTTNLITNGIAFAVGNSISNVTCSGTTATITFTNPYSTNPFVPGSVISVAGTIAPTGYTGGFIVVSVTGTNQVSYNVASALTNSTSVSGVTVTSQRTQNNQFIHPYSAGPANIASNLSLGQLTQNLALWYDAANYSSLTLNGSSVLTWSSRLGNVAYATNVLAPVNSLFPLKYVTNSQNGLPGLEVMSAVALTGVVLTSVTTSTNILTVTSNSVAIVPNQLITFATATSGIAINTYYIVRSGVTGTAPSYTFTVATSIGGAAVSIPVTTTGLTIQCQLFTVGLMNTSGISANNVSTANTNTEFTYFYVLKRNVAGINAQLTQQIVSLGAPTGTRFLLVDGLFTMADGTVAAAINSQTTSMNYATRGGLLNDTPMILCVYKRGRDLYSRMIGGGKTSQFTQTFSRDTQMPTSSSLQLYVGTYGSSTNVGFNGTLYEMMFFRDALTDQAIQQTEGYLARKWGLTGSLPQTHAYYEIKT